jgi:hypothetical protein
MQGMARIRSIKPEYWLDAEILKISDAAALCFIGLWNIADDEGKVLWDYRAISAQLGGRWSATTVQKLCKKLATVARLRCDSTATWFQVVNWQHQKIDRPHTPKVKAADLQWIASDDLEAIERLFASHSSNDRRKDRIGSDRIGSDLGSEPVQFALTSEPSEAPRGRGRGRTKGGRAPAQTTEVFEAYREELLARHGVEPADNQVIRSQMAMLIKRVGREDAPEIVRHYVRHNRAYYVEHRHPFGACLRDWERLRAEWLSGRTVTSHEARTVEQRQTNANSFGAILREAKGGANG